jgi:hypothetical protein
MTKNPIHSQPIPLHIDRAARAMDAVLAGEVDPQIRLDVGAALAILVDVCPPYPPLPDSVHATLAAEGIALAIAELTAAIETAATPGEAIRAGLAARELRLIGARP